jgi:hypothetical protein
MALKPLLDVYEVDGAQLDKSVAGFRGRPSIRGSSAKNGDNL